MVPGRQQVNIYRLYLGEVEVIYQVRIGRSPFEWGNEGYIYRSLVLVNESVRGKSRYHAKIWTKKKRCMCRALVLLGIVIDKSRRLDYV